MPRGLVVQRARAAADVFLLDVTEAVLIEWDLERGRMASTLVARTRALAAGAPLPLTRASPRSPAIPHRAAKLRHSDSSNSRLCRYRSSRRPRP